MQIDHSRPYLEIIKERAQHFHPYPQRVVEQFEQVDRARFVPEDLRERFLDRVHTDSGCAGLLSEPGVIFDMVAYLFLKGDEVVFEGGTGTGYQTAILARLARHVVTAESDRERMRSAKDRLDTLGITNVTFLHGDAAYGAPQFGPYDRMIFGAASSGFMDQVLIDQMADRCRLLIPTGTYDPARRLVVGDLLQVDKRNGSVVQRINPNYGGTLAFVPLVSSRPIGWTLVNGEYVPSSEDREGA
jgi:protein-L-isoaspartate(D-aspartate) O-methyltransferase